MLAWLHAVLVGTFKDSQGQTNSLLLFLYIVVLGSMLFVWKSLDAGTTEERKEVVGKTVHHTKIAKAAVPSAFYYMIFGLNLLFLLGVMSRSSEHRDWIAGIVRDVRASKIDPSSVASALKEPSPSPPSPPSQTEGSGGSAPPSASVQPSSPPSPMPPMPKDKDKEKNRETIV